MTHNCKSDDTPCDKAIETPEGFTLCPITGKRFGLFLLNQHDDEEDEDTEETYFLSDNEEEEETLNDAMSFALRQLINDYDNLFIFDAYLMELTRLYREYEMTNSPLEFVISTLFIMVEGGFGDLCKYPNLYLQKYLIDRSNLKDVSLQKHLITSGKTTWCSKLGEGYDDDDEFTSFSRRKKQVTVTMKSHDDIVSQYSKIHKKENQFLLIL